MQTKYIERETLIRTIKALSCILAITLVAFAVLIITAPSQDPIAYANGNERGIERAYALSPTDVCLSDEELARIEAEEKAKHDAAAKEAERVAREQEEAQAEAETEAESATEAEVVDEQYYPEEEYYDYSYDDSYTDYAYDDGDGWYNTDGLTASSGVNYYNDRKETYYSSNVSYHYMTPEWTLGDDGVYRDADGYVVVAANENDYAYGDVIDTSFGEAKVYDTGCDSGVTDVYVNW